MPVPKNLLDMAGPSAGAALGGAPQGTGVVRVERLRAGDSVNYGLNYVTREPA